jgi:hypothetical protein
VKEVQRYQHATRKAYGKPKNVDKGKDFVFLQVPPGDLDIVS